MIKIQKKKKVINIHFTALKSSEEKAFKSINGGEVLE